MRGLAHDPSLLRGANCLGGGHEECVGQSRAFVAQARVPGGIEASKRTAGGGVQWRARGRRCSPRPKRSTRFAAAGQCGRRSRPCPRRAGRPRCGRRCRAGFPPRSGWREPGQSGAARFRVPQREAAGSRTNRGRRREPSAIHRFERAGRCVRKRKNKRLRIVERPRWRQIRGPALRGPEGVKSPRGKLASKIDRTLSKL